MISFTAMILLMLSIENVNGQTNEMDSSSIAASFELIKIQNAVEAYDSMNFDVEIVATEGSYADTLNASYTMLGDFYKAVFDSIIQIQNQYINLEVHEAGKMLIVSKPEPFSKQFLKGNIEEGLFQQMNVGSISITSAGGNKTIHFNFLPESEYDTYTVTYNPVTYRVSEAYFKIRIIGDDGLPISGQFSSMRIRFSNFIPISGPVSFDTGAYVYPLNGSAFARQTAYNDYELINLFEVQ